MSSRVVFPPPPLALSKVDRGLELLGGEVLPFVAFFRGGTGGCSSMLGAPCCCCGLRGLYGGRGGGSLPEECMGGAFFCERVCVITGGLAGKGGGAFGPAVAPWLWLLGRGGRGMSALEGG